MGRDEQRAAPVDAPVDGCNDAPVDGPVDGADRAPADEAGCTPAGGAVAGAGPVEASVGGLDRTPDDEPSAETGVPLHDLLAGVTAMHAATGRVVGAAGRSWSLSDAQVRDAVEDLTRLGSRVEAARLAAIRALDARPGAVAGASVGRVAATFLVGRLHVDPGRAAADVAAAHAFDPESGSLPAVGAALAEGLITKEHAVVCVKAASRLPKRLQNVQIPTDPDDEDPAGAGLAADSETASDGGACDDAEPRVLSGAQVADRWLARQACRFGVREVGRLGDQLLALLAPERTDRFDRDAHLRRGVSFYRDSTGMGVLRAQLTPADAVLMDALLAAVSAPTPARACLTRADNDRDGQADRDGDADRDGKHLAMIRDDRTRSMRQYDGLMAVLHAGIARTGTTPTDSDTTAGDSASGDTAADHAARDSHADPDGHDDASNSSSTNSSGGAGRGSSGAGSGCTGSGSFAAPTPPVTVLITATTEQLIAAGIAASTRTPTAASTGNATSAQQPPTAGLAHVQHTGPVHPDLLAYLTCSPTLQRVLLAPSGAPLDVGRSHRLATTAQRRALAARDGGCVIPACGCPHEGTDAHHLVPWSRGGGTDLDNLVSLCPAHHQQVHAGVWTIEIIDGIPWARPPSWIDPQRRLTRNTFHRHATPTTQRLGQQLRLALDHHEQAQHPPDAAAA
jgi:hypothetical protein